METGGGDSSETGSATEEGKQKSTTGVSASLTPDFSDKEESKKHDKTELTTRTSTH